MTFSELLKKYKEGTLTEEEKILVENELEKNEAINNYLAENLELDSITSTIDERPSVISAKKVRKSVNHKLFKVILLSVAIVFSIILSINYIVSPLIASKYYNPTKHSLSKYQSNFVFDVRALNELINPGYGISYASAENNGFGNYTLSLESNNLFTKEKTSINYILKKNEPYARYNYFDNNNNAIRYNPLWSESKSSEAYKKELEYKEKETKEIINYLAKLPNTNYVSSYVLFGEDITLNELRELMYKYPSLKFNWTAIRVSNEKVQLPLGFRIDPSGDCQTMDTDYYNKYPALLLGDYLRTDDADSANGLVPIYTKHFKSLLEYLAHNTDFVNALTNFDLDFDKYLNFIENNGIKSYGALIYGNPNDIIDFYENENILTIDIDNVLPSIYSSK